jgi:hypothetical protein
VPSWSLVDGRSWRQRLQIIPPPPENRSPCMHLPGSTWPSVPERSPG